MQPQSRATEQFLLAAKHAEIHALEQLAVSCEVVTGVSDLIHQLQRERGLSNIYLASQGARFGEQRQAQVGLSRDSEKRLRQLLNMHYLGAQGAKGAKTAASAPLGGMRLLNSIAFVLQGLDNLAELRRQVEQREIGAVDATAALCRLIAGLLSVVFEAADIAGDPAVTRVLVAMFNLMQGKEYAGQERAWAANGFAAGHFNETLCDRLRHLQDAQQRSFEVFTEFAGDELAASWQTLESSREVGDLKRLREMIRGLCRGEPIAPELSEVWYDLATHRIDQMRELELRLADSLQRVSRQQLTRAQASLQAHRDRLQALAAIEAPPGSPLTMLFDTEVLGLGAAEGPAPAEQPGPPDMARSVYDLVRGQAEHIRRMGEELNDARRALTERKQIERAKGLLMQSFNLSEEQAYRRMQQRAMELNVRLAEVAVTLIKASEQARGRAPRS